MARTSPWPTRNSGLGRAFAVGNLADPVVLADLIVLADTWSCWPIPGRARRHLIVLADDPIVLADDPIVLADPARADPTPTISAGCRSS